MTRPIDVAPDIIEDILLRLPVKSLLRFKCVSKSWNSLLSSPAFASMHLEQAWRTNILTSTPSGLSLLAYETSFGDEIQLDFPSKRPNGRVRIIGSCHGLVAVALEESKDFFIWNPLTRDYKKLPDPCFPSTVETQNFPSTKDGFFHGFGYDSSTDDYKLLFSTRRLHWLRPPVINSIREETIVALFSLRKNSWKMIQSPPTNTLFLSHHKFSGCFVNGALNWLSGRRQSEEILTFDLKTERFGKVAVPNHRIMGFVIMNMGALDGRLCLAFYNLEIYLKESPSSSSYTYPVELWVMKQYGVKESWTKFLTIVDKYNYRHLPLCISKGKEVIMLNEQKDLIRSDADESILEKYRICKCSPENFKYCSMFDHSCQAIVYAESLLSPNANIIEDEQQIKAETTRKKNML